MKKIKLYLLNFVILPLVLVLSTELVERGSFVSALNWPFLYPAEFFVSCLLVLGLLSIFMAVTNNQEISFFVVLTISLLFALVSNTKQKFLGEPLLPYDFILSKETTDIINYFSSFINTKIILFLGLLVLLGVVLFRYLPLNKHRVKYSVLERIVLLLLSLIIFSSISSGSPLPLKEKFALQSITWDQKLNSSRNGLLLSFLTNLQWLSVEQPVDYNQGRITHIVNKSTGTDGAIPATGSPAVKPNIIIVMNEAFWDPGLLPGISFNQDPLPFFHSLQNKHSAGSLLVPVFGGGTVNTEFEVLTGHSTHFLPGGSIAYAQYVRKPVESLASILTGQGYTATAIHSYHNWFYRRDQVFRNFGFAKFISGEFFVEPELKRYYISDREVSRLIIEESQKTTGPFFVFAVTMQNHGPYVIGYGDQAKIKVQGDLSPEAKSIVETYARGVAEADQALQILVEHFQKSKQPTIIVFFGDHLPALGEDYQVYREIGFYQQDNTYEEYQRMHTVPLVIWSNYLPRVPGLKLNSSFLGPYLLQQAGLKGSFYTDYLFSLWQKKPFFPGRSYYRAAGIDDKYLEDYRLLQYDLLFGQNYLAQGKPAPIMQEGYFLGKEKMRIESAHFWEEEKAKQGKGKLEISGKNFTPACQVYLNEKPQKTTFVDENHLTIAASEKILTQLKNLTIQVKLGDSLQNIIAESNCVLLSEMLK